MHKIDKQAFPMTVAQYAEALGTNTMRVYRMIEAGQLKTKPGRPVLILGTVRKAAVSARQWRHAVREAAYYSGLPRHKWGVEGAGTLKVLVGAEGVTIRPGATVWALEAACERIAALAGK